MWTIEPIFQTKWVLLIGLVLVGASIVQLLRENAGRYRIGRLILRLMTIFAVLGVLFNPSFISSKDDPGKSRLVILLDTSASMATPDVADRNRFEAAKEAVLEPKVLKRLTDAFELEFRTFDKTVKIEDPGMVQVDATLGRGTDLSQAIRSAVALLSGGPARTEDAGTGGLLLLSDGRATEGDVTEAAQLALAGSIPIWTVPLGGPVPPRDIRIDTGSDEILAFSGTPAVLSGRIIQEGFPDQSFEIQLLEDEKVLQVQEVIPAPGGDGKFRFEVTAPQKGEHRYVLRVAPQPGEANPWNNQRAIFLRAVGEKVKVLVAEGQPHWDAKFLVQALKRHERVDLTAVYNLGNDRYSSVVSKQGKARRETDNLFPTTERELLDYDVVFLGRQCESFFRPQTESMLTRFVSNRGGGLVFFRGKAYGGRFLPLAKLEPVVWNSGTDADVFFKITDSGRTHPSFDSEFWAALAGNVTALPRLDRVQRTRGIKPLAKVLAVSHSANGDPGNGNILMAYHRYGRGRVLTMNADGMWRWAFQDASGPLPEDAYSRFWMSLIRWLLSTGDFMPGQDISLTADRRYYTEEDQVTLNIATKDLLPETYRPVIEITGPDMTESIRPTADTGGHYAAVLGPFAPGTYTVVLKNNMGSPAEIRTQVEVTAAEAEFKDLSADPDLMDQIARITDGTRLRLDQLDRLPDIVRDWQRRRRLSDDPQSRWDTWWLLVGVIGFLSGEWYLRRREDLL